ncbi:hypothetical protein HPB52_020516 [Rhipicephalus sanguineus]|uniref:Uncharacterized protein n=1 Tax=Rhipicephalus sanguineus TaxID=34632 RepID=A0A9D4Q767_RHISA|nr:hypothetical protein HPB52_020516 [Rhipicephalus sanguineus]
MAANPPKVTYPPGIKAISDDLSTDDLVRRLKECAQTFQNLSQDEDNSAYVQLALHLAGEGFLNHNSKDVRLLVACCIADVFRVFAPEAPYKDPEQLKTIFLFFIEQLRGLEDPKDPTFKRYFYLLENLAWVKSFNICIELEDNQAIFCQLFSLIFTIVNDNHSNKVKNFMLDMMCPLITEADTVSQGLLDIVLKQIIEPCKTQNKNAYNLAKDVLKRTLNTIEPYIQSFFNNALVLGRTSNSTVAPQLYELIYELNILCPSMLIAVLPQLEFKLKCNDEKERLSVTKLLARMFSDKNSDLAAQNPPLLELLPWQVRSPNKWGFTYPSIFNDISEHVRMRCVQYSMHFLLNHPKLRNDITGGWCSFFGIKPRREFGAAFLNDVYIKADCLDSVAAGRAPPSWARFDAVFFVHILRHLKMASLKQNSRRRGFSEGRFQATDWLSRGALFKRAFPSLPLAGATDQCGC